MVGFRAGGRVGGPPALWLLAGIYSFLPVSSPRFPPPNPPRRERRDNITVPLHPLDLGHCLDRRRCDPGSAIRRRASRRSLRRDALAPDRSNARRPRARAVRRPEPAERLLQIGRAHV